jgi:hypothetical protein
MPAVGGRGYNSHGLALKGDTVNKSAFAVLTFVAIAGVGAGAFANIPGPPPTPSARLSIDVDVKPIDGQPGRFMVSSTVTDLENNAIIGKPQLMIAAGKTARIETGAEGKWMLQISVTADGDARKAAYDATFTRDGQVVSKQRVSVNLNS